MAVFKAGAGLCKAAIGIPLDEFIKACPEHPSNTHKTLEQICNLLAETGIIWLTLPFGRTAIDYVSRPILRDFKNALIDDYDLRTLWTALTRTSGGGIEQHWIPETLGALLPGQSIKFPQVQLIPAIRQIGPKAEAFSDFSGRGLIDRLAEIQSPDHDKRVERDMFNSINAFLQIVTARESAQIEVPHHREHLLVHMDNKVLPLPSLGTGIHEVIMIAAFCTLSQDQIMCIEEPEIHLHPLLQRKLISYLQTNTQNQYFIATHSPSFIDTPNAAIFHVSNDGNQTRIKESVLRGERFAICMDLGTKASDILQSNAVIWVEGPSDRIYLQYWIETAVPEFVEGIHYSIMFYGGRLLSHLSANDEDVNEFISLRSLNQHLAIVMDSDKSSPQKPINATKERLLAELSKKPGVAWITKGREIENYIRHEVLQEAVKTVHSEIYDSPSEGGTYDHAFYFNRKRAKVGDGDKIEREIDKVKVAKIVCDRVPDWDVLDLKTRIEELVAMIREANK